jgi:MerR family mercuric resistance operon transcriptional regulator
MPSENRLTISRLAQLGGVNLETVRYYEREGLIPKAPRSRAGYRLFPPDASKRLRFIKRAQELGFSLAEIRDLLGIRVRKGGDRAEVRARVLAKINDIDQKIHSLQSIKRTLGGLASRCELCGPSTACPILESLDHEAD